MAAGPVWKMVAISFQQHIVRVVHLEVVQGGPLNTLIPNTCLQQPMSGKPGLSPIGIWYLFFSSSFFFFFFFHEVWAIRHQNCQSCVYVMYISSTIQPIAIIIFKTIHQRILLWYSPRIGLQNWERNTLYHPNGSASRLDLIYRLSQKMIIGLSASVSFEFVNWFDHLNML